MILKLKYRFFVPTSSYRVMDRYEDDYSIEVDGDDVEYTYEPDEQDVIDYLRRTHSDEDIINDYIEEIYNTGDETWKNDFKSDFGVDEITAKSLLNSFETNESKEFFMKDIIEDLVSDTEIYYDELLDYFESDAEAEFNYYRD